jgi:hypothetical protein
MRLLLTMALLAQVWVGSAQVYWNKQIDWQHNFEYLSSIVAVDAFQSIIVAGGMLQLNPTDENIYLSRISENGETIWAKSSRPFPDKLGKGGQVYQIDQHYGLVLGNAYLPSANGTTDMQMVLVKFDMDSGDVIWTKEYGKPDWMEYPWRMIKNSDGSLVMIGQTIQMNNNPPQKILFIKIDSLGNQLVRKEFVVNITRNHSAWDIVGSPDGGFFILGSDNYWGNCNGCSTETGMAEMILLKTDFDGNLLWSKVYSPWEFKQSGLAGYDIKLVSDTTLMVVGHKQYTLLNSSFSYFSRYILMKFDLNGNVLDSVSFGGYAGAYPTRAIKLADKNYLITGQEKDSTFNLVGPTGVIIKIASSLNVIWKKEYRVSPPESQLHDKFDDAVEMPDKGFIICGRAFGPLEDSTNQNGWVIRVDSFGCLEPGCQLNSAIEDPPTPKQDIGITLSPNPTSGQARLTLAHEGAVLLGVRVLDVQGRVVSDMQFLRGAGWRECVVDLGGEPAGVYLVQVRTSEGWGVRKIVKQ